jgi:hypothetical protein
MDVVPTYCLAKEKDGDLHVVTTSENGKVFCRREFKDAEKADQFWERERQRLQFGS